LDESELDEELEALQQEELDNKMLHTGNVPVADQIGRLPSAPEAGELNTHEETCWTETEFNLAVKGKAPAREEEEDEEEELRKLQAEMAM